MRESDHHTKGNSGRYMLKLLTLGWWRSRWEGAQFLVPQAASPVLRLQTEGLGGGTWCL